MEQKVLAIIHAPGVSKKKKRRLVEKLRDFLEWLDIENVKIKVNPIFHIPEHGFLSRWNTIIVAWGLESEPEWSKWAQDNGLLKIARQFWAVDLFERHSFYGHILNRPKIKAGSYWSRKTRQGKMRLFLKGYYIQSKEPYGMKRIPKIDPLQISLSKPPHYVLDFGDPEKVEIVKQIFNMYVLHNRSRTEICNLLNAQEVKAPWNSSIWKTRNIKAILKNPVYIGANGYSGSIRYDVFPSILDKSIFFEAQAKISREQTPRDTLQVITKQIYSDKKY